MVAKGAFRSISGRHHRNDEFTDCLGQSLDQTIERKSRENPNTESLIVVASEDVFFPKLVEVDDFYSPSPIDATPEKELTTKRKTRTPKKIQETPESEPKPRLSSRNSKAETPSAPIHPIQTITSPIPIETSDIVISDSPTIPAQTKIKTPPQQKKLKRSNYDSDDSWEPDVLAKPQPKKRQKRHDASSEDSWEQNFVDSQTRIKKSASPTTPSPRPRRRKLVESEDEAEFYDSFFEGETNGSNDITILEDHVPMETIGSQNVSPSKVETEYKTRSSLGSKFPEILLPKLPPIETESGTGFHDNFEDPHRKHRTPNCFLDRENDETYQKVVLDFGDTQMATTNQYPPTNEWFDVPVGEILVHEDNSTVCPTAIKY